jgi:hypothetical protein
MKKDLDSNIAEAPREWKKKTFRSENIITMRLPCFKDGHQRDIRDILNICSMYYSTASDWLEKYGSSNRTIELSSFMSRLQVQMSEKEADRRPV